ncbi:MULTISPECIES: ribonuclease P protein component [Rubrivivax]|uniref:Ribonuclease P protein component n=1 Tax=Rubrivivax benzoatilyticus TaxID=316997 RepID=A0ABX0HWN9_9BURK|nr:MULTISPECIES: ribonuclease P protein component [Rubrivivax]MCC9596737.1 ribonuclease P protein component [Rubrivivax sp. JA1055]MCC9648894.1 ribonuclease P protein component [Rubrivivax sp. JA1029]NHK98731.1 ribonuclease P protein component [Rubrivivax benzoatilyticus]NHL24233.1 ribonuclease P protein component [Rubrivivax benzoatilyticus]
MKPIVQKADFERVLATPSRSRSAHFAVHHVSGGPCASRWQRLHTAESKLSTGDAHAGAQPVDDSARPAPEGCWLGSVVPKRHARRSVTRVLLKRQIRAAMARHADVLPPGLWVVRLRAPFAVAQFPSAASDALRQAARAELEQLFGRARRS